MDANKRMRFLFIQEQKQQQEQHRTTSNLRRMALNEVQRFIRKTFNCSNIGGKKKCEMRLSMPEFIQTGKGVWPDCSRQCVSVQAHIFKTVFTFN